MISDKNLVALLILLDARTHNASEMYWSRGLNRVLDDAELCPESVEEERGALMDLERPDRFEME